MSSGKINDSATQRLSDSATQRLGDSAKSNRHPATRHWVTFATRRTLAYISVLDLGCIWERCLRRAGIPIKYSQGYNPRPKLNFAAPLPTGCGGEAELMDITLHTPMLAEAILTALQAYTLDDLEIKRVDAVPDNTPTFSKILTAAEYQVWLHNVSPEQLQTRRDSLMEAEQVLLPKRGRKHRGKMYNLRALIHDLQSLTPPPPWGAGLWLQVSARPGATGRPDEVLKALKLTDVPRRCTRTRLILEESRIKNQE